MIIVSFLLLLQPTGMNAVFFYAVIVWPFLKFLFLLGQFLFEFFESHGDVQFKDYNLQFKPHKFPKEEMLIAFRE